MSNPRQENEPSDSTILVSALGWLGVIFIFVLIVLIAYIPNRSVSQEEQDAAARLEIRRSMEAEQTRLVNAYEWVNQSENVVRIPVEEAMKLAVEELRTEQKGRTGNPQ